MNKNYWLNPAYCLFNKVAIKEQNGCFIKFLLLEDDILLEERLKKSFVNFIEQKRKEENHPEIFDGTIKIEFEKGTVSELQKYVSELYESKNGQNCEKEKALEKTSKEFDNAAAVILLDSILSEARNSKATDIHIEKNCVRFRINGKLENRIILQKEKASEVIQRIKLLAGMNVLEKRKSQDGHFIFGETNPLFVRASIMSIISENQGSLEESVVLRILDTTRIPLSITQLGFSEIQYEGIKTLCAEKNGLIVICGPTGAGKSTTAASMLLDIQKKKNGRLKIVSLEDPPEYILPGITQIQIDDTRNNTYDDALVHVFRQDPDVIMIGEIRDEKSAVAAIRASLTGHLVVATLHTMSAAGSVLRLENLGIGRKIIASVLKGVIVQDLNYSDGMPDLLADVALPQYSFAPDINEQMGEIEIEKLFMHLTNYSEAMEKTFERRKKNPVVPVLPVIPVVKTPKNLKAAIKEA